MHVGQYYPQQQSYEYQPFEGQEDNFRWNKENYESVIRDYYMKDLAI